MKPSLCGDPYHPERARSQPHRLRSTWLETSTAASRHPYITLQNGAYSTQVAIALKDEWLSAYCPYKKMLIGAIGAADWSTAKARETLQQKVSTPC